MVALGISGWLAHRFAGRIQRVQEQLRQLAAQQYVQTEVAPPHDELYELQSSANQLAARLAALQAEIIHTERVRLLAQIAGGLAHQLRNAVTGARMAVELHARRCAAAEHDTTLDVALRQLSLTEEQIKGLLALGARRPQELRGGDLRQIAASIDTLVEPICRHVQVSFTSSAELPNDAAHVRDADSLRAALLNLVLNGIEAAGPGGEVSLEIAMEQGEVVASVYDSGPGPPPATQQSLFEPFVTSKPEGVGLGLTLAQHTARHYGGSLSWERVDGRTAFRMRWPRPIGADEQKTELPPSETTPSSAAKGIAT
jgi:signal transduction histidine kinase